jgi:hypothetical protein
VAEKGQEKSLEMRVAELEDKLSKLHITEEEWKAYQKVHTALGGGVGGGVGLSPQVCVIRSCIVRACISTCSIACIISSCINECSCGPCIQSGGGGGVGGGFGGLGT